MVTLEKRKGSPQINDGSCLRNRKKEAQSKTKKEMIKIK